MVHIAVENAEVVSIPFWVTDIQKFRQWAHSQDFPEAGRIWWLDGEVWVDMTMEEIFTHVEVKSEIGAVLRLLARQLDLGRYLTDGVLLTNVAADISGVPDGLFISNKTLLSNRARFLEGSEAGFTELEGSPDMVLEIVSRSSVQKDTVLLKKAYWEAGIREYWLVDARRDPIQFIIYRSSSRGYVATRKHEGWSASTVFGKSFRLTKTMTAPGQPSFTLGVR